MPQRQRVNQTSEEGAPQPVSQSASQRLLVGRLNGKLARQFWVGTTTLSGNQAGKADRNASAETGRELIVRLLVCCTSK